MDLNDCANVHDTAYQYDPLNVLQLMSISLDRTFQQAQQLYHPPVIRDKIIYLLKN